MTTVATLQVAAMFRDNVTTGLNRLSDRIRFAGMRLRNAGIGLTIAMAPFAYIFKGMVGNAMEYEAVSRGINVVSKATGRNVADVMAVINKHSGELMTKLDLTRGVLKLLSTSLTEVQIDEFIVMVKNGAAAMGEDMSVAFSMVSKGLKTYRMQNFDLIGVNERMIGIYKQVNRELSNSQKAYIYAIDRSQELTSEQKDAIIEQTIFTNVQKKSAVFMGIFAEYLRSTSGRVASLKTSISDLSASLGSFLLPEVVKIVSKLKKVVDTINNLDDNIKKHTITITGWVALLGTVAGVILMVGGNFIWAAAQITMFITGAKGLTIAQLPSLIAGMISFGAAILIVVMAAGIIIDVLFKVRDTIMDVGTAIAKFITSISLKIAEVLVSWSELTGDTAGVKRWQMQVRILNKEMEEMTRRAEEYKESGKDIRDIAMLPWTTLDLKRGGGWKRAIEEWLSGDVIPPLVEPTGEGVTPTPTFAPPTGAGAAGNLIINFYAPDGTYGGSSNIGSIASLFGKSGQDTVINAGAPNRYE